MDNHNGGSYPANTSDLKTFLVCGMTGVGKSTFINHVTGAQLSVSDDIHSDTVDIIEKDIPLIKAGKEYIQLVDTPGFGDSRETSETVVLRRISIWLAARYISNIPVTGVLFLRPIHDVRVNRLEKDLMAMFRDLCGQDCLDHIVLVTTRWTPELTIDGGVRESNIMTDPECFGADGEKKVQVRRLNENYSSEEAQLLVKSCAGLSPVTFQIQREVVDEGKTLGETKAGMRIGADLEERLLGLEEKARKVSKCAEAARRKLEEAERAKFQLEEELAREAGRARQAAEAAEQARRVAEAERVSAEQERKEAEERVKKAKEAAEEAQRAAAAERERQEKERKETEERARKAAKAAEEARRAAEAEKKRMEEERKEREEREKRAKEEAEAARRAAEAERARLERERKEAEERTRKAKEVAEEARRAAEAERQRLEKLRKEAEERAREAERVLAAQKAAEEERARLERERAERERIEREQGIRRKAEAFAIAAGQHMHQAAMVVHQQAQQAAIAAQPHVQHAVNETARFGDMVFQATAREWQRHNANCLLM